MYLQGDIHDIIKTIETDSIDLIYTNPPFGTTKCKWDIPLRWNDLWNDIWRIMKPKGIVVLHSAMPFTYQLIQSQLPKYHYTLIKNNSTGFFHAKHQPLRNTEEVLIFYKKPGTYNPQMMGNDIIINKRSYFNNGNEYYGKSKTKFKEKTQVGRYPNTALPMKICVRSGKTIPDSIIEYFIKTYSNENDTVLDMTTHNKVVGNIVTKLNRKFIGVDLLEIK
tara:strand:+ start:139 stop:801 length:663 start_codon:yes stop_codon:yes gene_type:complete